MGLTDFRNIHANETAWVIGSGSSLNHIDPLLFADKWCMCVNFAGITLGLSRFYSVSHHHDDAQWIAEQQPDLTVFTTEFEQIPLEDKSESRPTAANVIFVPTTEQHYERWNPEVHWPMEPDVLTVGPSSIHLTMHLAAYMGARSIILVGADCGEFDGASRVNDYRHPDGHLHYGIWTNALVAMSNKLRSMGIGVYSLNPWVTPALEGHSYESAGIRIN